MDAQDPARVNVSAENAFGIGGHRRFGETNVPLSFYTERSADQWRCGGAAARLVDLLPVVLPSF